MKHVVDKGKSQTQKDKVGENFYNRGVLQLRDRRRSDPQRAAHHRQEGGDRRGRAARLRDAHDHATRAGRRSGLEGFAAPMKVTCDDHNGHHSAYMQQWDGTKWVKVSDWIAPMKDKVRPLLEAASKDYVSKDPAWPKRTRAVRQVELMLSLHPSPRLWGGSASEASRGGGRAVINRSTPTPLASLHSVSDPPHKGEGRSP